MIDETVHHITKHNFPSHTSLKLIFFIPGAILMATIAPPYGRISPNLGCMKVASFGILGII